MRRSGSPAVARSASPGTTRGPAGRAWSWRADSASPRSRVPTGSPGASRRPVSPCSPSTSADWGRAAIAQTPNADCPAAVRNAGRYTTPAALLRLTGRGVLDDLGGLVGRPPLLVPLVGPPGTVALLTTPDAVADSEAALDPDGRYPEWQQSVAARSALRIGAYRPGRWASRVACPLLVLVADQDRSALSAPAVRAARRAARGELVTLEGGHYAPFLDGHEQAVQAEVSFLRRHLLERVPQQPVGKS